MTAHEPVAPHKPLDWLGLQARVCVVTGAASGIGAAIAAELLHAGAHVALLDRDGAALDQAVNALQGHGAKVIGLVCDITNEEAVQAAAMRVREVLGPCTALVNNAGLLRPVELDSVPLDTWNDLLAVNLTGYLLCARTFGAQMRQCGGGDIVHIASISAHYPQPGGGPYSPSKAAVLMLSRQIATEWAPWGIRSNAISPGMVRTPLSAPFFSQADMDARRSTVTASRRIGEPADIANTVLFLLSARSSYVNGAELVVDGGLDCMLMEMLPRPEPTPQASP